MKMVKTVLLVLFITLFCSDSLHAQSSLFDLKDLSNIQVDDYSDDEISSMLNKASESGISQTQLLNLLASRGLPADQINELRYRFNFTSTERPLNKNNLSDNIENDSLKIRHPYDTSKSRLPLQKFKNDELIFSSELFTTNSMVFEPNLHISTPAGYILGPDDEIIVYVYGYSEKKYTLTVNEQGEIYIPNVGPIFVQWLEYGTGR